MKRYIPYLLFLVTIPTSPYILGLISAFSGSTADARYKSVFLTVYTFSLYGVFFLYFYTVYRILNNAKSTRKIQVLKKSWELQEYQEKQLKETQKHTLMHQDAIKEQLLILQKHLQENNTADISADIRKISEFCTSTRLSKFCSDTLLNAILFSKKEEAERLNIHVDFQVFLTGSLHFTETVITTVFFNLLNNGIEGCKASNAPNPVLTLKIEYNSGFLHVKMVNSKNPSLVFTHKTTKQDPEAHGFGLKIIEHTIEKYDGTYEWLDHGDTFESLLMFRAI